MKSNVAVLLIAALVGVGLWYLGGHVAANAENNADFVTLYETAKAARARKPLYASAEPVIVVKKAFAEAPVTVQGDALPAVPAVESTADAAFSLIESTADAAFPVVESTESVIAGAAGGEVLVTVPAATASAGFRYPPYVALMLIPLGLISTVKTAALAWYWINVLIVVLILALSMCVLSGRFGIGRKGMFLVPLFVSAPLIYYFLPTEAMTLFALLVVLAGLAAFRARVDIVAGFFSSVALFSPLGMVFGFYYLLKRSWMGLLGWLVGVVLLFAVVPILIFGPQRSWDEMEAYRIRVVRPWLESVTLENLASADNQSVWGMLTRRAADIDYVGGRVSDLGKAHEIVAPRVTDNWTILVFAGIAAVFFVGTFIGAARKLRDRSGAIVGLEGAVVVLGTLILAPFTPMPTLAALLFPVFAVVFVVMSTEFRRAVHHIGYVGLVIAGAFFYLTFDPGFREAGAAFTGTAILWIAVLAGINRFRPQMVHGHAAAAFASGRDKTLDKPVELAKVPSRREKREARKGTTVLPMPEFAKHIEADEEPEQPRGMAKLFANFKGKDLPPVDMHADDSGDQPFEVDEPKDSPDNGNGDRKIPLE